MKRVSMALVAVCLVTSHSIVQGADMRGGDRNAPDSRPVVARTSFTKQSLGVRQNADGSVCYPAPFYEYCHYDYNNYYVQQLYRLWTFYTVWNGASESDPPQPNYTKQPVATPAPAPPPVTSVLHEYN